MGRRRGDGALTPYMKEKILSIYAVTNSYTETAKQCSCSPSTVMNIIAEKQDDFNEIREQKKQELVDEIWSTLVDAQKLGNKYIKEALDGEREIPLNHVSNYFGTMYDKQALMTGENTQNIGGDGIQVVLNMPDVEDEEEWKNKQS